MSKEEVWLISLTIPRVFEKNLDFLLVCTGLMIWCVAIVVEWVIFHTSTCPGYMLWVQQKKKRKKEKRKKKSSIFSLFVIPKKHKLGEIQKMGMWG